MLQVIFGNYGNNTIALMRWAYEQKLKQIYVVTVDTGWHASLWPQKVLQGNALACAYGFIPVLLSAQPNLGEQIVERKQFPSAKFQWCAGFIKGLPLLQWLDQNDPLCQATLLMGSRCADSPAREHLAEFIEHSEHFGGRRVWHPLYRYTDEQRNQLIQAAGWSVLPHRSLECNPCIHNHPSDAKYLDTESLSRCERIEKQINRCFFRDDLGVDIPIQKYHQTYKKTLNEHHPLTYFQMGCGSFYACGE